MADFSYTWDGPGQVALASAVDQSAQYRQVGFALIDYLRDLCGWTVERSSPGDGTAGAGDNIVNEADIVWGTANTENHSWALMRPPVGKGNPSGGAQQGLVIDFAHVNAADATPQNVMLYLGHGPAIDNGDANSRAVLQSEETLLTLTMIPWAAPVAGSICRYTNDNGDMIFGLKANGDLFFRAGIILASDPDNAIGENTLWMFAFGAAGSVFTATQLTLANNFRALRADASAFTTSPIFHSMPLNLTNWSTGQESVQGRVPWRDVEVLANSATGGEQRNFGLLRDVLACPPGNVFNQADPNDDGGEAPYEWRSIGSIVVPSNADVT